VTLPKGRVLLDAYLEMNLVSGAEFKPFSLSPDVWYGVTDDITVGLVHSAVGGSGFMGFVGTSLCLTGTDNGCAKLYDNVGVDARYQLKDGGFGVAFDGGLFVQDFDPFQLALKLGIVGRWRPKPASKLAVDVSPNMFFGLTGRDGGGGVGDAANKEVLTLPATLLYAAKPKLALAFQLGFVVPFENAGTTFFIPVSFGANYMLSKRTSIDGAFTVLHLAAGDDAGGKGFDVRTFTLGGGYAL
jgi:hypothetical protein